MQQSQANVNHAASQFVPIGAIDIRPGHNPRTYFDEESLNELAQSIKNTGLLQAIIVRPKGERFELVAGERRLRASKLAYGDEGVIEASVRELTDDQMADAAFIENLQREQMGPAEEAEAAAKMVGRCNGDREEAARRLGLRSVQVLEHRLALMNCSPKVREALNTRKILLGHAELLAAVPKETQDQVLSNMLQLESRPSVAELKAMLAQVACKLTSAIFDQDGCLQCPHNSALQGLLFSEAIESGRCTNPSCFNDKTELTLQARAEKLKDEFPVVRIARPGDNYTLTKLQAEGRNGVGKQQAEACRGCANFGAAVSAVPDKMGQVFTSLCFDAQCNSKMVAKEIERARDAEATARKAERKAAAPKAEVVAVKDSTPVKEYRIKIWRQALKKELFHNPGCNLAVLIAVGITGNARHINSIAMRSGFQELTGKTVDMINIAEAAASVMECSDEQRKTLLTALAATVANDVEETQLIKLLKWMNVDLSAHWKLCEDYLKLLTKSAIDVICEQIGVKAAMGEAFEKLMAGKKDDLIKGVLNVPGFDYVGKIPANMHWAKA